MKLHYLLLFLGLVFLGAAYAELDLPPVEPKPESAVMQTEQPMNLSSLNLPPVAPRTALADMGTNVPQLASINLPPTEPDVVEPRLEDFTGGWNTEDFPDAVEDKDAVEIENFIWSRRGGLEPRPGYATYCDDEISAGEHIWGLYSYYKEDDKIVMVGLNGSVLADTTGSCAWRTIKSGLQSNDKFYNFETFLGKALVVHEDDHPFAYDFDNDNTNTEIFDFGQSDSGWGHYSCNTILGEISACTANVVTKPQSWEVDEHQGKVVEITFTATSDNYWFFILGNTTKTLFLDGNCHTCDGCPLCSVMPSAYTVTYHIYSFYNNLIDTDTLRAEVLYVADKYPCSDSIFLSACPPDSFVGARYTMQSISGGSKGEEHFLKYINCIAADSCLVFPTHEYGSADYSGLVDGDSVRFVRKGMWTARDIEIYKNRVWLLDSDEDVIYFSDRNSISDFNSNNWVAVSNQDGNKVTALATFYNDQLGYKDNSKDMLVIFKENSIYTLTFNSADDYYLVQVEDRVGCIAPQSIANIEGKYIIFLHDTGVYAFDGRTVKLISQKIHSEIEEIERASDNDESAGGYCDRHYYLSSPCMWDVGDTSITTADFICNFNMDSAGAGRDGIWTRKIDSAGVRVGDADFFNVDNAALDHYSDIASDTTGRYVVALMQPSPTASGYNELYIKKFTAADVAVGDTIRVTDAGRFAHVGEDPPEITMDNDGDIIICWTSEDEEDAGKVDVYCQYLTWDDGKIDTNFVVNSDWETTDYLHTPYPAVDLNNSDQFVVAWQDARDAGSIGHQIYGQIYSIQEGTGVTASGSNLEISSSFEAGDAPVQPAVSVNNQNFVVSWGAAKGGSAKDIWKRYYDIDGTALETPGVQVSAGEAGRNSQWSDVSLNDWGQYVVSWMKDKAGYDAEDVFILRYNGLNADGSIEQVNTGDEANWSFDAFPSVALNNDSVFVVVWMDERNGVATPLIYYQAYAWLDSLGSDSMLTQTQDIGFQPRLDCPGYLLIDTLEYALAWNWDFGGWSKMVNYQAGLYATQHGATDTVNLFFSDPADRSYIYQFGKVFQDTSQDIAVAFKSKAFDFNSISNQKRVNRFFINYYLDAGSFDLEFFTDFGDTSQYTTSVSTNGGYRYARVPLDWTCRGRTFSFKLSSTDDLRISKIRLRLKQEED